MPDGSTPCQGGIGSADPWLRHVIPQCGHPKSGKQLCFWHGHAFLAVYEPRGNHLQQCSCCRALGRLRARLGSAKHGLMGLLGLPAGQQVARGVPASAHCVWRLLLLLLSLCWHALALCTCQGLRGLLQLLRLCMQL